MPRNGGRGSQVPLGNNYIIRTGAEAGGLLVICEEQGGEPRERYKHKDTRIQVKSILKAPIQNNSYSI